MLEPARCRRDHVARCCVRIAARAIVQRHRVHRGVLRIAVRGYSK
jgi:hypothetical protein